MPAKIDWDRLHIDGDNRPPVNLRDTQRARFQGAGSRYQRGGFYGR